MPIKHRTYNPKLILALISVAFFWGTTYLAMRIGVETIPPMLVVSYRNLLAGSLLLFYLIFKKQLKLIPVSTLKQNIIIAFLLLILANGLTTFAEKYISSGLAALISSLSPLGILVLNLRLGHEKLPIRNFTGIALALVGIFFIYQNNIDDLFNPDYRLGIAAILLAVFTWSLGTIYSKKLIQMGGNVLLNTGFQMLFAGVFLLILQYIVDPQINIALWSFSSIAAVVYLAIFGSLIGYISYSYALSQLPSTTVSVFLYINVIVALFLGWLILDEKIPLKIVMAAIFIISGVIISNYTNRRAKTYEIDAV